MWELEPPEQGREGGSGWMAWPSRRAGKSGCVCFIASRIDFSKYQNNVNICIMYEV